MGSDGHEDQPECQLGTLDRQPRGLAGGIAFAPGVMEEREIMQAIAELDEVSRELTALINENQGILGTFPLPLVLTRR